MSFHLEAKKGDYSNIVLMPGDPNRSTAISKFLTDTVVVNTARGCLGYTGYYNGQKISVQTSGMGQPSLSIYVNELITEYNVDTIIRIGTCGALQEQVEVNTVVLSLAAASEFQHFNISPSCDYDLLTSVISQLKNYNLTVSCGTTASVDNFYSIGDFTDMCIKNNVLAVDMETYALYFHAMRNKCKALTVNLVSDSLVSGNKCKLTNSQKIMSDTLEKMVIAVLDALTL